MTKYGFVFEGPDKKTESSPSDDFDVKLRQLIAALLPDLTPNRHSNLCERIEELVYDNIPRVPAAGRDRNAVLEELLTHRDMWNCPDWKCPHHNNDSDDPHLCRSCFWVWLESMRSHPTPPQSNGALANNGRGN